MVVREFEGVAGYGKNEQQDANKKMRDGSYNELHYNGLMTDLGLFPSLYHLEEYSLQEHALLHLCVIVSNLAEMFFVVTLAKRLYSLLFLPSFLLLLSSRARARTTRVLFFCCHKCHSRWS